MARKVRKRPAPSPSAGMKEDLRDFILAHGEVFPEESLKGLTAYLEAYHDVKLGKEELQSLLLEEIKSIKAARKARKIEKELFTPADRIDLGSCFCPRCSRFKEYRKECPHCGHHEMTI